MTDTDERIAQIRGRYEQTTAQLTDHQFNELCVTMARRDIPWLLAELEKVRGVASDVERMASDSETTDLYADPVGTQDAVRALLLKVAAMIRG